MSARIFRKSGDVVSRRVAGELYLVPVKGRVAELQRLFSLNRVAECVWEHLDGHRSLDELAGVVVERFDVDAARASGDVAALVRSLQEHGLVEELG